MTRKASFAGSFYPSGAKELNNVIDIFEAAFKDEKEELDIDSRIAIVPHAGYVYSGFTASLAYRVLARGGIKRVVVIGPSHHRYFEGVQIGGFDAYETPLGDLKGDVELANTLISSFAGAHRYCFIEEGHREHSTEVQFPFIAHYLGGCKILEVVYCSSSPNEVAPLIEHCLGLEECAVVISSDLSHYYSEEEAHKLDMNCLEGIAQMDSELIDERCEACGKIGISALLCPAKKLGLKPTILDYRTSASASGDRDRVVGYVSAVFAPLSPSESQRL